VPTPKTPEEIAGTVFSRNNLEHDAEHEHGPQPDDYESRHQSPPVPKKGNRKSSSSCRSSPSKRERRQGEYSAES
jgi:hypothetical protein